MVGHPRRGGEPALRPCQATLVGEGAVGVRQAQVAVERGPEGQVELGERDGGVGPEHVGRVPQDAQVRGSDLAVHDVVDGHAVAVRQRRPVERAAGRVVHPHGPRHRCEEGRRRVDDGPAGEHLERRRVAHEVRGGRDGLGAAVQLVLHRHDDGGSAERGEHGDPCDPGAAGARGRAGGRARQRRHGAGGAATGGTHLAARGRRGRCPRPARLHKTSVFSEHLQPPAPGRRARACPRTWSRW